MDGKTELDKYNAGRRDDRIHAIIEETGRRAYRTAIRKIYISMKDPEIDHEAWIVDEIKRTGNEDLLSKE